MKSILEDSETSKYGIGKVTRKGDFNKDLEKEKRKRKETLQNRGLGV